MATQRKGATVTLRVKQLPHAKGLPLPAYQSPEAAGVDLVAAVPAKKPIRLKPGQRALVPTGLIIELPKGTEAQVRPRSGLAVKHGVTVLNSPGTIDSDYRGEVQVILINHGEKAFVIARGERIAQMVVAPVTRARLVIATDVSLTQRGSGGFGSTGTVTAKPKPAKPVKAVRGKSQAAAQKTRDGKRLVRVSNKRT